MKQTNPFLMPNVCYLIVTCLYNINNNEKTKDFYENADKIIFTIIFDLFFLNYDWRRYICGIRINRSVHVFPIFIGSQDKINDHLP